MHVSGWHDRHLAYMDVLVVLHVGMLPNPRNTYSYSAPTAKIIKKRTRKLN